MCVYGWGKNHLVSFCRHWQTCNWYTPLGFEQLLLRELRQNVTGANIFFICAQKNDCACETIEVGLDYYTESQWNKMYGQCNRVWWHHCFAYRITCFKFFVSLKIKGFLQNQLHHKGLMLTWSTIWIFIKPSKPWICIVDMRVCGLDYWNGTPNWTTRLAYFWFLWLVQLMRNKKAIF